MHMNDKEFDQYIRSIMIDAEEEVPSRLWSSIATKAGIAPAPKVRKINWKYATSAMIGMAASIAAAFLILNPSNLKEETETFEVIAQTEVQSPIQPEVSNEEIIPSSEYLAYTQTPVKPMLTENVQVLHDDAQVEEEASLPPVTQTTEPEIEEEIQDRSRISAEDVSVSTTTSSNAQEKTQQENAGQTVDPFALMAFEDMQKESKRKVSFHIGSSMLTNGNASGLRQRVYSKFNPDKNSPTIEQTSKESSYSIPISFGLGARIPLNDRWAIETGLSYSFMERKFTGVYTESSNEDVQAIKSENIQHSLHYIGVPVHFSYDLYQSNRTQFYTYFGAELEKAVLNKYRIPSSNGDINFTQGVKGLQFSASLGLGVTFLITDYLGIYIDPSLQYFFKCGQPTSIRTQQPLQMGFEAGLRFNL